jgi:competence protein ComEC
VRAIPAMNDLAEAQRGTLLLWMPFGLALGIGAYFTLRFEPQLAHFGTLVGIGIACFLLIRIAPFWLKIPLLAVQLTSIGFLNAGISANRKAAPVLGYHYYGPVEGRIIAIDRSASDKPRITLDQVRLRRQNPRYTPHKIRISLHYPRQFVPLEPGRIIAVTASLSPPSGPVEPGGFDFQRFAWFRGLGAIGYSRTPLLEIAPPKQQGWTKGLMQLRMHLASEIRSKIDGQAGAFAAAILTGDRSAINPEMLKRLRASNLAHLLAISGLHMGLLTGFVFAFIRYGLALIPPLALRLPVKKIATAGAFFVAVAYLFLSGANVATQRAFIMVAVMLLAILLDRRALTLRAVALAAVIVLLLRPESLIEAGFQMSFAATTALVAVFAYLRDHNIFVGSGARIPGPVRWVLALLLSSAVAGAATAPISALHFNQIAQYGLLANLLSVPAMGSFVMPAAVVGILLAPFGLDGLAWTLMGAGIDWILFVSGKIAELKGALVHIVKPATSVLALICGGAIVLILLRSRLRLFAITLILVGFWLWNATERPAMLLSRNGRLMGVMTETGRGLNREKGTGFIARNWLENDGDGADQIAASMRKAFTNQGDLTVVDLNGLKVAYYWAKGLETREIAKLCAEFSLVILPQSKTRQADCHLINKSDLRRMGAVAITSKGQALNIIGARQVTGTRLWSR